MALPNLQKELRKAAPRTTLSWELYLKKRRLKILAVVLILIILLGLISYFKIKKNNAAKELTAAVIATETIEKGTQITGDNIEIRSFERASLPEGFKADFTEVIDLYATQEIPKNGIISESDLRKVVSSDSLALNLDEEEVAFTIDGNWLESRLPKLSKGDSVNVLVSNPYRSIDDTVFLVEKAEVIDLSLDPKSTSSSFVTIKISPEESRNLLYARSHELLFSIVLTQ